MKNKILVKVETQSWRKVLSFNTRIPQKGQKLFFSNDRKTQPIFMKILEVKICEEND